MELKRRLWKVVDKGLRRAGLERISQRWIKELSIRDGIVKIEFRNGFRYIGVQPEIRGLKSSPNPIFTEGASCPSD